MRALTVDELKALKLGDWVWVKVLKPDHPRRYYDGEYCRITPPYMDGLCYGWQGSGGCYMYSDYGKTWLAWKNKEAAESKDEIVELPCILKSNSTYPKNQVVYINEFGSVIVERFSYEHEAERRLAELKGEL